MRRCRLRRSAAGPILPPMTALRIASYNIRKCVGLDRRRDPERVLGVIAGLGADIVALQEADRRLGARPSTLDPARIGAVTGLAEPLGGLVGGAAVSFIAPLIPWALAFAGGAMLYIISHEIIPETHRHGHQDAATTGLTIGLIVMLILDVALG